MVARVVNFSMIPRQQQWICFVSDSLLNRFLLEQSTQIRTESDTYQSPLACRDF